MEASLRLTNTGPRHPQPLFETLRPDFDNDTLSLYHEANTLASIGKYADAHNFYENQLSLKSFHPILSLQQASVYCKQGLWQEAVAVLDKSLNSHAEWENTQHPNLVPVLQARRAYATMQSTGNLSAGLQAARKLRRILILQPFEEMTDIEVSISTQNKWLQS